MNRVLALIFAVALAIPTLNAANDVDAEALQNYIQALEQRLEQLEAQTGVIQERQVQIEEETMTYLESLGALKELSDRVELSGNVDVIYSSSDDDAAGDSNDVFVDQVYLGLAIDVSDNVSAYVSLQDEDTADNNARIGGNDGQIGVYEASVTIGLSDGLSLTAGQQHFNFINDAEYGNFIADTLVRQMAECRDTGLALSLSNDAISGGVFALNGSEDEAGDDDEVNTYGVHASIGGDQEDLSWTLGAAYISNVQDANNGGNGIDDANAGDISAYSLNASVTAGSLTVLAEMVQADDNDDDSAEESATSIEASMALPMGEGDWTISAKIEEADDGGANDVEDNVGIGLSSEIYENANLTINWESSEDFNGNETDTVAVELSVSF
jgi:predicted porin